MSVLLTDHRSTARLALYPTTTTTTAAAAAAAAARHLGQWPVFVKEMKHPPIRTASPGSACRCLEKVRGRRRSQDQHSQEPQSVRIGGHWRCRGHSIRCCQQRLSRMWEWDISESRTVDMNSSFKLTQRALCIWMCGILEVPRSERFSSARFPRPWYSLEMAGC